jgi:hypothetical protein
MTAGTAPGRIVLIGSGEIGPSMAPLHRSIVASLPKRSTPSSLVALDGSYDFQTNRAEMGEKIAVFFRSKVGIPTTVIGLPETDRAGADLAPSALAPTIAGLNAADLIFLGPGSPSRALRRWGGTPIVEQLIARIQNGATLITSSAAAAASGRHTIPVYEIYKAGTNPVWLDGLDIIGALAGLAVAIVPHWNNNEGATHDTSRCFIGEGRLQYSWDRRDSAAQRRNRVVGHICRTIRRCSRCTTATGCDERNTSPRASNRPWGRCE